MKWKHIKVGDEMKIEAPNKKAIYYAKSKPIETIKEHTDQLLENLEILKEKYGTKIVKDSDMEEERFWKLMEVICIYHDSGKVFSGFQNAIRKNINMELLYTPFHNGEIKHEQISPMFVPCKKYNMTPDERKLVYQAIYYHHERDNVIHINRELLKEIIEKDIKPNFDKIEEALATEIAEPKTFYLGLVEGQARIVQGDNLYKDYCIMKGLLHRLDHCSSAKIKVEDQTNEEIANFIEEFIKEKGSTPNNLQLFAKRNQEKNLLIIGSTGIGKTEGSLLWSKNDKTFFTLPLRISINAIYERIRKNVGYSHVGLLHSTALDYLEEKVESLKDAKEQIENQEIAKIEQSRNLYEKITTCTIDQIFPFVFKYRGYEKIYATLGYSKVIIDEIQAYSPQIVAIILKGLQMVNDLGGKFMVMTATLPRIYKEKLEEMGINFEYQEFIKNTKRHKIKLLDKKIDEDINEMYEKSKDKKVLIIVNTVNKAIELYENLKKIGTNNLNILHSRFTQEDRNQKEEIIKEFSNKETQKGIWITTQIVEASLDIDFDILYTEMSTLDSVFQRLGRCYRSRDYEGKEPNIGIYKKETTGVGYIYDKEIYEKSICLLEKYDGEILEEKIKIELVDKLYSKKMLEGTEFYRDFEKAFSFLENIVDYDTSKKEAQKILRNIENIEVIPKSIYDENLSLFEQYEVEKDFKQKADQKRNLNKLFISISRSNLWKLSDKIINCPNMTNKYIIDMKYDKEMGLLLKIDEEYELETREL